MNIGTSVQYHIAAKLQKHKNNNQLQSFLSLRNSEKERKGWDYKFYFAFVMLVQLHSNNK